MIRTCKICNKVINRQTYSNYCGTHAAKVKIFTREHKLHISLAKTKDKVGYRGIHCWIVKLLGKPDKCSYCLNDKLKHRQYQWANISHQYKRDITDWIRLCVKCHKAYDASKISL